MLYMYQSTKPKTIVFVCKMHYIQYFLSDVNEEITSSNKTHMYASTTHSKEEVYVHVVENLESFLSSSASTELIYLSGKG